MKYADSIKVLKNNLWNNTKCKEIVKGCDEMYECNDGLAVPVGKLLPKLKSVIDANCFDAYKKAHKKLCAFLATNHNELKRIRNQNEAHKTEEFDIQVKSIEDLKVSESINLIQEGNVLLFNLNAAFLIVHASLMKHLGEIMKKN